MNTDSRIRRGLRSSRSSAWRFALPSAALCLIGVAQGCDGSGDAMGVGGSGSPSGGGSAEGGSDSGAPVDPEEGTRAVGVSISAIEVNQAVGIRLVDGGRPVPVSERRAPIIAGRPGLFRVSVETAEGHRVRELEGRLTLTRSDGTTKVLTDRRLVVRASSDADLGTQFHWHFDETAIEEGTTFAVGIFETSDEAPAGASSGSRYPESGSAAFDEWADRLELKVVLVPVETGCGSKLLVSDEALEGNRKYIFDAFPLQKLTITYREAWRKIEGCPSGVGEIAAEALAARIEDDAPDDVLYAALSGPGSFAEGGALGQAFGTVGSAPYSGNGAGPDGVGAIIVHELGHNLGRPHPWEEDESYPYDDEGGYVGWGYRRSTRMLVPSDGRHDVMSYTYPTWMSEYTYRKCAEFLKDHPPSGL